MKKYLGILVLLMVSISFCAKAQYNNIKIGIDNLRPILIYERTTDENFSAEFGVEYGPIMSYEVPILSCTETFTYKRTIYGLMSNLRAFPSKKHIAPNGFFIGTDIRYFIIEDQISDIIVTNNLINFGANLGYQLIWGNFTMETLIGFSDVINFSLDNSLRPKECHTGPELNNVGKIRFQFCIGVIFPKFKKLK